MKPFHIRATDKVVECWSGCRIQFIGMESNPFQKVLKGELKAALAQLVIPAGAILSGYYDTTDPRPVDAENSLFTNVLDEMPKGVLAVSFEQGPSAPPAPPNPVDLVCGHIHYYRYEVDGQWSAWEAGQVLASWNRAPRRVPGDGSARPAWFALRDANLRGMVELTGAKLAPSSPFGLKITVHATNSGPRNAITNSESIVDGIIAAFHSDGFSDGVFSALGPKLPNVTGDELRDALDNPIGPIFDTPAIIAKSGFVQISPADERCLIGELRIVKDSTSRWPELSGELFTIRRVNFS